MAKEKDRKSIAIFALFGMIWAVIAACVLPRIYGPFITPDEFGYWAHAARFVGYDWSGAASLFSYYSFGYGMLLFPFFKLIQNPVVLYRVIIGIHFLLAWASSLFVYGVMKELLPHAERKRVAVISGASMLYVAYLTYAQTTFCESLLVFLYALEAFAVCRLCRKASVGNAILVLAVAGYMYAVHMRTVGILLATVLFLLFLLFSKEEKKPGKGLAAAGVVLILLCVILAAVGMVKENWIALADSADYVERAKRNSYAGQLARLKKLFSLSGIYYFFSSLAGKLFYIGCATFGVYFWGAGRLLKQALQTAKKWRARRKAGGRRKAGESPGTGSREGTSGQSEISSREETSGQPEISSREKLAVWLVLSHLGSLLVAVIAGAGSGGRMDSILYGRYFENSIPLILAAGISALTEKTDFSKKLMLYIGLQSLLFFAAFFLVRGGGYTTFNNHSVTGILYAVALADRYDNYILLYAFCGGLAGCIVLLLANRISAGRGLWAVPCAAVCILQLWLGAFSTEHFTLSGSETRKENSAMLMQAAELLEDREGVFLTGAGEKAVCFAQFMLREPLRVQSLEAYLENPQTADGESVIVIRRHPEAEALLTEQYANVLWSPVYAVFYN